MKSSELLNVLMSLDLPPKSIYPEIREDMAKAGELSHKSHTAAGPGDDLHRFQFWAAVERFAPEALTKLLQTADVDAWARKHKLTLHGSVPDWVLQQAEAIRRDCQKHGIKRCPPDPPVAGVAGCYCVLTGGIASAGPLSEPGQWIKVEASTIFMPFWLRSKTQRKNIREAILRDCERKIDAEFERIVRLSQLQQLRPMMNELYLERFVRFQVNGTQVRDLVSEVCPSRDRGKRKEYTDSIWIALSRVAALLGLSLRKGIRGRPSHRK